MASVRSHVQMAITQILYRIYAKFVKIIALNAKGIIILAQVAS